MNYFFDITIVFLLFKPRPIPSFSTTTVPIISVKTSNLLPVRRCRQHNISSLYYNHSRYPGIFSIFSWNAFCKIKNTLGRCTHPYPTPSFTHGNISKYLLIHIFAVSCQYKVFVIRRSLS